MNSLRTISTLAALATGLIGTAAAAATPVGVWIDHTGRGAVEIAECGGNLCGHVVWLKEAKNKQVCRNKVLGDVKPVSNGVWDRGWIIDPDDNARYSVELKPVGEDRLRVTGYMGSKLFSETMIWRRAPADLQRCDGKDVPTTTASIPQLPPPVAPAASTPVPPVPQRATREPDYEIAPPDSPAPAPPPARQATAPVPLPPIAAPAPVPARVVAPAQVAAPAPLPRQAAEEGEPQPASGRGKGKSKGTSRDCRIDLPYLGRIKVPCDAL